jgi:hypothetical protein
MVWKSWGGAALVPAIVLLLLAVAPPLCSGADDVAVGFSAAPRRVSRSPSAAFAFRVTLTGAGGGPCGDCTVTCQVSRQPIHSSPSLVRGVHARILPQTPMHALPPHFQVLHWSWPWLLFLLVAMEPDRTTDK